MFTVDQGTLDAVSNASYYNPHEVLGGHFAQDDERTVTVRVLRPLASSVDIITE